MIFQRRANLAWLSLGLFLFVAWREPRLGQDGLFEFDPAERPWAPHWLPEVEAQDASVLAVQGGLRLAYRVHRPEAPDQLLLRSGLEEPAAEAKVLGKRWVAPILCGGPGVHNLPGPGATPALCYGYEEEGSEQDGAPLWRVALDRLPLSPPGITAIAHRAEGRIGQGTWVVWQQAGKSSWDIHARHVTYGEQAPFLPEQAEAHAIEVVADSARGDWAPDVTQLPDGSVCVVWDRFDGRSFDVAARWRIDGRWQDPFLVAGGPAFQGKARVASDDNGRVFCSWEEGSEGWGRTFRGRPREWNNNTDAEGPLHRFRALRLAELRRDGRVGLVGEGPPQPAFARMARAPGRRPGVERTGVYYERAEIAFDGEGRLWMAWRHFVAPQLATEEATRHHVESGWRVYLSSLGQAGWSAPVAFEGQQRDGGQGLDLAVHGGRVQLAWTAGRSDRRPQKSGRRGVALVEVPTAEAPAGPASSALDWRAQKPLSSPQPRPATPVHRLGDESYELLLGDLHRHTDLSLCFPYYDGSIDDAYRYATEVAGLDFLALTDHTRDIAEGEVTSQLWSRVTAAVDRHQLPGLFTTLHAYERSRGSTDHNVVTLRPELLRPFQPPLEEFWALLDGNTLTIPHNPVQPKTWKIRDERHRPLLEIYQGCRDQDSASAAHEGLATGQRFGFIASSDHMSTSASYAGVWSSGRDRESLFRSLQARRTFGATAPIALRLHTQAGAWMGEFVGAEEALTLDWSIEGTAPLESVEWILNGELVRQETDLAGKRRAAGSWEPERPSKGPGWIYLRCRQADGNRAWSSPLFWEARG